MNPLPMGGRRERRRPRRPPPQPPSGTPPGQPPPTPATENNAPLAGAIKSAVFALVVALLLGAAALAGKTSIAAAWFVLFIIWLIVLYFIKRHRVLVAVVSGLTLVGVGIWLQPAPEKPAPMPVVVATPRPVGTPTALNLVVSVPVSFVRRSEGTSTMWWHVSRRAEIAIPIDLLVATRLVNMTPEQVEITGFIMEIGHDEAWTRLRPLPVTEPFGGPQDTQVYFGPKNAAREVRVLEPDLNGALFHKPLAPREPVRAFGCFRYPTGFYPAETDQFRITFIDGFKRRSVTPIKFSTDENLEGFAMKYLGDSTRDLSGLPEIR
jgi:hypothetical protein